MLARLLLVALMAIGPAAHASNSANAKALLDQARAVIDGSVSWSAKSQAERMKLVASSNELAKRGEAFFSTSTGTAKSSCMALFQGIGEYAFGLNALALSAEGRVQRHSSELLGFSRAAVSLGEHYRTCSDAIRGGGAPTLLL